MYFRLHKKRNSNTNLYCKEHTHRSLENESMTSQPSFQSIPRRPRNDWLGRFRYMVPISIPGCSDYIRAGHVKHKLSMKKYCTEAFQDKSPLKKQKPDHFLRKKSNNDLWLGKLVANLCPLSDMTKSAMRHSHLLALVNPRPEDKFSAAPLL